MAQLALHVCNLRGRVTLPAAYNTDSASEHERLGIAVSSASLNTTTSGGTQQAAMMTTSMHTGTGSSDPKNLPPVKLLPSARLRFVLRVGRREAERELGLRENGSSHR